MRTRVLILAPAGRDAPLIRDVLSRAGIVGYLCGDMSELCAGLRSGAAVALIAEEALTEDRLPELLEWTAGQPSWSDLPFIVLRDRRYSQRDAGRKLVFLQSAASITLLDRPIHSETLVSSVKAALRARSRQYEVQASLAALADSEQRYRTLAEALPQLVWTSLPTGHIDFLSRQWVDYTGIGAEEQLGLGWISKVVHSDDRQSVLDALLKAVRNRHELNLELRLRRHDGEYRSFKMRGTPIRDTRGNLIKWFGTCTDITDIVLAREISARSRADLENLVDARTKSLGEANNRLTREIADRQRAEDQLRQAQKLEAIGQLTSGVAHDFNNLLMAVMGNIDLAAKRVANDEAAVRSLRSAVRAVERGARLTSQLLAFSRKQRLAPKSIDVNRLVGDSGDMLFRTIGNSVRIETVLASGLWPAMVDPNQLELVLLNLAINGRDAMKEGGRLTITTQNVVEADRPPDLSPQDYVMVSVADSGVGMTDDVRRRAFEPFFTTKDVGKGSGLGLSMVHGVAVQSGGNVYIESVPGKGTTVRIYLPRAAERPPEGATPDEGGTLLGGSATILVVDDDADVREVAVSGLEEFGYRVIEAENGHQALEILAEVPDVDLVLVDMAMPGMNGAETVRRARHRNPNIRALFVTGYESTAAFEPGSRDMLLRKPYRLEALAEAVKQALLATPKSNVVPMKTGRGA